MKKYLSAALLASLLLAPSFAFADFQQSVDLGRTQAASLSQQQLDGLNTRVFSDAFLVAKIIGYDRSEIEQLKADVRQLRDENAQLRAQITSRPAAVASAPSASSSNIEERISRLETSFASLQGTLMTVVTMLTRLVAAM